jgi:hypothetical protein
MLLFETKGDYGGQTILAQELKGVAHNVVPARDENSG